MQDQAEDEQSTKGLSSKEAGLALLFSTASLLLATVCFHFHLNLSTAGLLQLLLVLSVSLKRGFAHAALVSITAFLCLNFLFTDPVFNFHVIDQQNWVALITFEVTALLVGGLSNKLQLQAALTEEQRARAVKLYELSRAVLLLDDRRPTGEQLAAVMRSVLGVDNVEIWTTHDASDNQRPSFSRVDKQRPYQAYLQNRDHDDLAAHCSDRVLRLGTHAIGGLTLSGWSVDPLSADAAASIAAIAYERAHAAQKESRAEAERDAERLRSAVLDGLAHSFKTPLTAIQTASSGLIAIDHLNTTQLELVSIIDERATMLGDLTTRLLQTAALEAREVRVARLSGVIANMVCNFIDEQPEAIRNRVRLETSSNPGPDFYDGSLIELALQQLLDNALKYSAMETPIFIRVTQTASETAIAVENTSVGGVSIRYEERERIFERFYRGLEAAQGPSGTGLGLSIVRKIADAHGGRAWAECSDDATLFTLSLPRFEKANNG